MFAAASQGHSQGAPAPAPQEEDAVCLPGEDLPEADQLGEDDAEARVDCTLCGTLTCPLNGNSFTYVPNGCGAQTRAAMAYQCSKSCNHTACTDSGLRSCI